MVKLPGDAGPDDGWAAKVTRAEDEESQRNKMGGGAPDTSGWNTTTTPPQLKSGPTEVEREPNPVAPPPVTESAPPLPVAAAPEEDADLLEMRRLGGIKEAVKAPTTADIKAPADIHRAFRDSIDESLVDDAVSRTKALTESKRREAKAVTAPAAAPSPQVGYNKFLESRGIGVDRRGVVESGAGDKSVWVLSDESRKELRETHQKAQVRIGGYVDKMFQPEFDKLNVQIQKYQSRFPGRELPESLRSRQQNLNANYQKAKEDSANKIVEANEIVEGKRPDKTLVLPLQVANTFAQTAQSIPASIIKGVGMGQAIIGKELGYKGEIDQNQLYKWGSSFEAWGHEQFPTDPQRAKEFSSFAAMAVGSAVGFYGPGMMANAVGHVARMTAAQRAMLVAATVTSIGMPVGATETVEDAYRSMRKGKKLTNRDLLMAWVAGAASGGSEALPVMNFIKVKSGGAGNWVVRYLEDALREGGQEVFQQAINDIAALIIHDPKRNILANMPEAFAGGFIGGAGMTAMRAGGNAAVARLKGTPASPQDAVEPSPVRGTPPRRNEDEAARSPNTATEAAPVPDASIPESQPERAPAVSIAPSTVEPGAPDAVPVKTRPVDAKTGAAEGNEVVTPDGSMTVPVETVLVELADLKFASGALQPRDRSRAESEVGVRERAASLDPQRLLPQRVSDGGAPIITKDGMIVSGNGRVMSIEQAYSTAALGNQAQSYRGALGADAEGMTQPVMVRRITADLPMPDLRKFADLSNRSSIAEMSATERATRDAEAAQSDVMQLYQGGSFEAPQNREFLKAFVESAVTPSERGSMAKDGRLTKAGEDRLNAAVLAASYGDPDVLSRMLESTDDNIKAVSGAMRDVSGLMMQLKASIAAGETDPAFDISEQVTDAARRIADMRTAGIRPSEALAQQDAFTAMDPVTEAFIRGFYNDSLTRAVSRQKMTSLLSMYIQEAQGHTQEGLIPDETTPQDVIDGARQRAFAEAEGLFADGTSSAGGIDAGDGQSDQRSESDGGGQEAATQDVNINTPEWAARFIPNETAKPVDQDQVDFFTDLFGPESVEDVDQTQPTAAMRGAFRELLAGKIPVGKLGKALAEHPSIDGDVYGGQLDALIEEAIEQGLLRRQKNGLRRTVAAKDYTPEQVEASPDEVADSVEPLVPASELAAASIEAHEADTGQLVDIGIATDVMLIEDARGSVAETQAVMDEITADPAFGKAEALELANIAGYPTNSRTTKQQAIDSIISRTQDILDEAELSATIEPEIDNAPSRNVSLERDSGDGAVDDGLGEADVSAPGRSDGLRDGQDGDADLQGDRLDNVGSLLDGDAASVGTQGDIPVHIEQPGDDASPAGSFDSDGSGSTGVPGDALEPIPAEKVSETASTSTGIKAAIAAQKAAESIPVVYGDTTNIRETLPLLKPAQQDDVVKAEARFSDPEALPGFLFTNGTGTGKTYTGLGVVKRFQRTGRENVLIVAPSQGILDGWIKASKQFNLSVSRLDDTKSAGSGIVATTYANMAMNTSLASRDWDLIVTDEAHKLSQNKAGNPSEALRAFRGLTNHSPFLRARAIMADQWAELERLRTLAEMTERPEDFRAVEEYISELDRRHNELMAEIAAKPKPRALMLSATPFAYRKSTDYAEGFLFAYPEDKHGYNNPGGQAEFLVRNFGYSMRYNRAEEPGPEVNVAVLERQFYENLKKDGALSGRRLEVEADYDRRFVLVDDAVGANIDTALNWLRDQANHKRMRPLLDLFMKRFDYLAQRRLLEAIKAHHLVPRIKRDMELGRKVVVFHDYIDGVGFNPFSLTVDPRSVPERSEEKITYGELHQEFLSANPFVTKLDFSSFTNPINTLTKAFSDAMLYNGRVSNGERRKVRDQFNKDGSGQDLIVVQSDAGEAGISLHDTTGAHQRVLYNLGLPTRPTRAIQQEGRIYREGQVSDAVMRYMSTGTSWERTAFAQTIAERASTAENLALGDEARALRDSFINAFEEADSIPQGDGEGKGGKATDRAGQAIASPFEKSKAFYFAEGKKRGRRDQREGKDYFSTPEPVGFKMAEWADVGLGESILEPSAGHGAISRWFSEGANRTLVEPSMTLSSRAGLSAPGAKVINGTFEDFNIVNKFDGIAMNPPFGSGGATAYAHVEKAFRHLRNRGRIVAIVPRGPAADKRYDKMLDSDANKNMYVLADIEMPTVMFERAGTKVATRILILERHDSADQAPNAVKRDLTGVEDINELFDRIEDMEFGSRLREKVEGVEPVREAQPDLSPSGTTSIAQGNNVTVQIPFNLGETVHGKTGEDLFVASMVERVERDVYNRLRSLAKTHGGYYSTFRGRGAIPGFQFNTETNRQEFINAVNRERFDTTAALGAAQRMMESRLKAGTTINISQSVRDQVAAALVPTLHAVPDGTDVGVLKTIVPIGPMQYKGKPDIKVDVQFDNLAGDSFGFILPWSEVVGTRALTVGEEFTKSDRPAIVTVRLSTAGVFDHTLSGGQWHELVHVYRRGGYLSDAVFDRFLSHALDLEVLDMELQLFLTKISDPSAGEAVPGETLTERYIRRYKDRPDIKEVIKQEAVAHMIELYHHGEYTTEQMAPIQDILHQFTSGELAGNPQGPINGDGIVSAVRGFDLDPVTPGLDLTQEARLARAEAMGFDTNTVWYRGRGNPFDPVQFDVSRQGFNFDHETTRTGIFFTDSPKVADAYAVEHSRNRAMTHNEQVRQKADLESRFDSSEEAIEYAKEKHGPKSVQTEEILIQGGGVGIALYAKTHVFAKRQFIGIVREYQGKWLFGDKGRDFTVPKGDLDDAENGGNIVPIYARTGKQKTIDMQEHFQGSYEASVLPQIKQAMADGYDSVILKTNPDALALREDGSFADELIVFDPSNIRSVNAVFDPANERSSQLLAAISAYHGSPHDFDRFSMDRIGTGEGAQAYGHGLYFAGNEAVAREYRSNLSYKQIVRDFKEQLPQDAEFEEVLELIGTGHFTPSQDRVLKALDADDWLGFDYPAQAISAAYGRKLDQWDASPELVQAVEESGHMYEVSLDVDENQLLDWDLPLGQQSDNVRETVLTVVEKHGYPRDVLDGTKVTGKSALEYVGNNAAGRLQISKSLSEAGIPGIKYLDQGSRGKGEGTYNYVIFDDSLIKITKKNGEPVTPAEHAEVVGAMREEQQAEALRPKAGTHEFTDSFVEALPAVSESVLAQVRQMLPANIAVQFVDSITRDGKAFDSAFYPTRKLVELSMDVGPTRAIELARHEAVHVARLMRLFTRREWSILSERAEKVGLRGTEQQAEFYRVQGERLGHMGQRLDRYVEEMMNQESVANLAERWAGDTEYGKRIGGFFSRIRDLFQAVVNAARGLGFQSANDVFQRLESGEIAGRDQVQTSETAIGQSILGVFGLSTETAEHEREWVDDAGGVAMWADEAGLRSRTYTSEAGSVAIAEQDDNTWSIQMIDGADIDGLLGLVEDVEEDIGQRLAPDGWLTQEQYEYWSDQDPILTEGHRQAGPLFHGMWASPGQIPVAIEMLTDAAGNTTERVTQMQRLQKLQTLQAVRNTMPSEMIGAMRHSMPGPGLGSANNAFAPLGTMDTSRPDRSLSDLVRTFNEHVTDMPRVAGGRMATQRLGRLPQGLKRQAARNNGWLAGVFNRMTGATRLEIPLDFVTLTHEGGHALEHRAATSGAIDSLKTKYAQELMMPPMPDSQPAAFPPQGYSGIELDEHAMAALMTYYEASSEVKALQRRSNAGYRTDSFTLETTTQTAETAAATLVRRLGQTPAEMVMSDFEAQGLPPHQAIAYANRRFTRTGTPQPRAMVLIEAEQLSEGWGDWFQTYLTDPDAAKATAPELFTEFTDEIDGLDPELLMILEELQDGYQELMAASPVSAMRSRIKSAFARGRREEALERYNERKNRRLSTSGPVSARGSAGIQTLGEELATSSYSWIRDYVDNKHPMKVAVKTLLDLGVANGNIAVEEGKKLFLKASANPYKLWRLATHTKTHAVATILHGPAINGSIDGVGPSVRDALVTAFGGDGAREFSVENQELFGTYLASRRLLAEWDRYDRGELPEPPDQMVSRNQLLQVIAEMDMQFPRFQDGAQQIYAFQNNFLTYLHEQGFLSEEDMLEYQSRADYVPLNRIMDRFGMINALKRATGVNKGKVMHRFLGSTRDIINPLESIVQGVFNFVERAETNAVGSRMLDLAEWAGDGGASIAERLPPTDMRATTVGVRETLMQAARSSGIARDDLGALMAEVDGLFDAEATATIFRPTMTQERPDERIMYVYRDGKRIPVLLGDNQIARDIYEQFGTFGQENTNFVMQTMVAGAQVLRAGVTKAPAYIYNNFFRDQVQVGAYTRDYTPFKTGFEGLKSVGKDADGSRRYTRFAGLMGGVDSNIMNLGNQKFGIGSFRSSGFWAVPGQWKAARGWNKFLRTMEITEAGSRVGHFESAFRRAIADNMSTEEAAIEAAYAADDVMPFGRRGSRMQTLSRIMHFANAGIQGVSATNRTIRGERDAPGETWRPAPFDATTNLEDEPFIKAMSGETLSNAERKRLPNSVRVWVAMAGLAGISLALKMWYSDEPEEDEANDYRSATHWRIRTADIKPFVPESVRENIPDWLYFPKPFDIAVIANLVESSYDRLVSGDETGAERFWKSLGHTVVPPHEVNAVALYYEMQSGVDFFSGRNIVPERLAPFDNHYQYDAYSSELAKVIGRNSSLSPKHVDHVIRRLGGTLGRDALTIGNYGASFFGGPSRIETPVEDAFIFGRNFGRAAVGSRSVEYFWRNMKRNGGEFTKVAKSYAALIDKGLTDPSANVEARQYLAGMDDDKRAYALLEAHFSEKHEDLHPLNRAKQVATIASRIKTSMVDGTLIRESTRKRGSTERETIELDPKTRRRVKTLFEKIAMREVHNAMKLSNIPGWKQKQIWNVKPLLVELRTLSPAVADEYEARLYKVGRDKIYPFEGVQKYWPEARKRLLKNGANADLSDLAAEAKYFGR